MSTMVVEPSFGPCEQWITAEDVFEFCPAAADDVGSDTAQLDEVALAASELLFEFSGRRFNGECETTVRPCRLGCGCWDGWGTSGWSLGAVSWGWGWNGMSGGWDFGWCGDSGSCGCRPLSQVELAGFPVTSIVEILIDGVPLDLVYAGGSPTYRVDMGNMLVRMDDPDAPTVHQRWPGCQNLALPTTEAGTWSVQYTYGQPPPTAGILAAKQLACQLWSSVNGGICAFPAGATKVVRQGITIDRTLFLAWGMKDGYWDTGMPLVDSFLMAYNKQGSTRRSAVWSPDVPQKPRHTGA